MQPLSPDDTERLAATGPTPAQHADEGESTRLALQLLGSLPPREQEVIRLKFQNDLSYREIARITRLSESNVGYLLHQGLKSLRQQMAVIQGAAS